MECIITRQLTIIGFALGVLVCVFSSGPALGDTNPVTGGYDCRFRYYGETYYAMVYVPSSFWHEELEPWDGVFTSKGRRHSHATPGHVYPCVLTYWWGDVTVTAAMTDAYYDNDFYYGYTRVSGATFSKNCHGYSTGFDGWPGMPVVIQDDYTATTVTDADLRYDTTPESHSVRIDAICDNGCGYDSVQARSEKYATSGVYCLSYYCPGGAGIWGNVYKKND